MKIMTLLDLLGRSYAVNDARRLRDPRPRHVTQRP
jgi:hypothetical protein